MYSSLPTPHVLNIVAPIGRDSTEVLVGLRRGLDALVLSGLVADAHGRDGLRVGPRLPHLAIRVERNSGAFVTRVPLPAAWAVAQ